MLRPATHFAPRTHKIARTGPSAVAPVICVSALAGVSGLVRETYGAKVLQHANRAAMLDIEVIEDRDCFIPHAMMSAFVSETSVRSGDACFGLHVVQHLQFSNYGCWGDFVLQAPTLGAAIARAAGSIGFHSSADRMTLSRCNGLARFEYASGSKGHDGYDHIACGIVGVMLSLCRNYLGCDWQPAAIELDIPRPRDRRVFERTFGCPIRFDTAVLAITFMSGLLNSQRPGKPADRLVTLDDVARARLEPASREDLRGIIATHIWAQVLAGGTSIDSTARSLDFSVRTLQRELNREGIDFRSLVNKARSRRAIELLRGTNATVTDISTELGYSAPAHFARAFRRETGLSPAEFRRVVAADQSDIRRDAAMDDPRDKDGWHGANLPMPQMGRQFPTNIRK